MKTSTLSVFALIGLAAISGPVQLAAQSVLLHVDVPFDFMVGSHSYAAGRYAVSSQSQHPILLQRADGKCSAFAIAMPVLANSKESTPRLVFQHTGGNYALSQVWGYGSTGKQLWIAKAKTPVIAKTETVTLYASN